MLTPSERRVLVALLCWLATGIVLDAVVEHRPQALVPLLGPERSLDVALAGRDPGDGGTAVAALAAFAATTVPGKSHARPGPGRGRGHVYDALGRLDLNLADSTDLVLLPGVGPALAGRILAAREKKGRFLSPQDLLDVRGIGEKTLAKLLPKVAVRTAQDSLAADTTRH
jgi:competence ComEA-like helix-hairpin-helix protein